MDNQEQAFMTKREDIMNWRKGIRLPLRKTPRLIRSATDNDFAVYEEHNILVNRNLPTKSLAQKFQASYWSFESPISSTLRTGSPRTSKYPKHNSKITPEKEPKYKPNISNDNRPPSYSYKGSVDSVINGFPKI